MSIKSKGLIALAASVAFAGMASAMPTPAYLKAAGASDMFEKESAKVVLMSTKDANVKKFANMMITDHTKSTAMVKAAAAKSGVTPPPPMLMPKQTAMLNELKGAKGTARDKLYITQQKAAHGEALATHQEYASTGDKPALKSTASQIVPVVQEHISMLNGMHAM
jgi:putative membrane protein